MADSVPACFRKRPGAQAAAAVEVPRKIGQHLEGAGGR
jgi:hypothetical protein